MKYEIVQRNIFLRGLTYNELKEKRSRLKEIPEDLRELMREAPDAYDKVDKHVIEELIGRKFDSIQHIEGTLKDGCMWYAPRTELLVEGMSIVMYTPSTKSYTNVTAAVAYIRGVSD